MSMTNMLRHQFEGFIRTPQIWQTPADFPYPLFYLPKNTISETPKDLDLPPSMVLGKRVERFFEYYITHYSDQEVVASNEQIIANKETLGELDFILRNSSSGVVTHVELIYKFYLLDPDCGSEGLDKWTGPNHRDNLLKKLNRLKTRQFPLLYSDATKPLLERLNLAAEDILQKMCFKANLFVPLDTQQQSYNPVNLEAITGFWIRAADFKPDIYANFLFYSPKKPDWPIDPSFCEQWFSYEEILPHIIKMLAREQSPLIWMKKTDGSYQRFFIVWW